MGLRIWACDPVSSSLIFVWSVNPVMTASTTISTATPRITPITEISVITLTALRFGLKYRHARKHSVRTLIRVNSNSFRGTDAPPRTVAK